MWRYLGFVLFVLSWDFFFVVFVFGMLWERAGCIALF